MDNKLPPLSFDDEDEIEQPQSGALPPLSFDEDDDAETQPVSVPQNVDAVPETSGREVDPAFVEGLSKRTGVPTEKLEAQMHRYGATYPDEALKSRGVSPLKSAATAGVYNLLDNVAFDIPSWVMKKIEDEPTEKAFDELKAQIDSQKTFGEKVTDVGAGMFSPAGIFSKGKGYLSTALEGMGMGGLFGVTNSKSGEELESGVTGAVTGGVAAPVLRGTTELGARGVSKMLGRGSDVATPYLKNPGKYDDLKFEDVQSRVEEPLEDFLGQYSKSKDAVKSSKEAAQIARETARQSRNEMMQNLRDTRFDDDLPDTLRQTIEQQRSKVGQLSAKQRETFRELEGVTANIDDLIGRIDNAIEARKVEGVLLPDDKQVAQLTKQRSILESMKRRKLEEFMREHGLESMDEVMTEDIQRLLAEGAQVKPETLIDLRQRLDDDIRDLYSQPAGGYSTSAERALKQQRGMLNDKLDEIGGDEYKKLRGQLSKEVDLTESASKEFGGPGARSKLSSLTNPNNAERLALLKRLDQASGGKIMPKINQYLNAQATLKDKPLLEKLIADLPESREARKAMEQVTKAEQEAAQLAQYHDKIGRLQPGDGVQSAIRKVMHAGPKKPETRTKEAIEELGKISGKPLLDDIEDLRVATAFAGGGPQGSRGIQLGRMAGKAMTGGSKVGEVLGGLGGGLVDYSTGKVAKLALKAHLWSQKPGTRLIGVTAGKVIPQLQASGPAGEHYAEVLDKAAERGPEAFMATHQTLLKDPAYQKILATEDTDG